MLCCAGFVISIISREEQFTESGRQIRWIMQGELRGPKQQFGTIHLSMVHNRQHCNIGLHFCAALLRRRLQLRPCPPQQGEERGVKRKATGGLHALPLPVGLHILSAHQVPEPQLGAS